MIKKILFAIFIFIVLCLAGLLILMYSLKPTYNGHIDIIGLDKNVEIQYDNHGIPHIYADSDKDAWRALGYAHAQDRLWQMELIRRVAAGRLSEIFGSVSIDSDRLFKTLGIHRFSQKCVSEFTTNTPPETQELTHAYLSGINQYIDNGPKPIEYYILGIEKSHFNIEDIYNVIGYMSYSFAIAHRTEPMLTYIQQQLGNEYLEDLDMTPDTSNTMIHSYPMEGLSELSFHVNDIIDNLPLPAFQGSNSWVIGPEKTTTGEVIFANDPHIGYSQPSVWYEAHIETPTTNMYGYYLAGYPFPLIGHTTDIAIGLTMLCNDDIDFYKEEIDENKAQYKFRNEWRPLTQHIDTIFVKNGKDVIIKTNETHHGPVMNGLLNTLEESDPVTMAWTYPKIQNDILKAAHGLLSSKSTEEVAKAAEMIHAAGLNVMYGDKDGNIAWWASAKLIKRPAHVNPKLIMDGVSGKDEPLGYYDFSENASSINPKQGYVYSANNQTVSKNGMLYPGYYVPEDRAQRITHLLDDKEKWSVDDVKKMMLDLTSENAVENVKYITASIDIEDPSSLEEKAMDMLNEWDGEFSTEKVAPTIYIKLMGLISYGQMEDELGEKKLEALKNIPIFRRSKPQLLSNESSIWWDDISTKDTKETKSEIITEAFEESISELKSQLGNDLKEWKWETVHTLEHEHTLGQVSGLKKYFNVGPFPVGGWSGVINNYHTKMDMDGTYHVHAGPSTRRIVDFSDVKRNSWSILPTGQSGNPQSPYFKDQAEMYVKGEYRKQLMDREEIKSMSSNTLTLNPKNIKQ